MEKRIMKHLLPIFLMVFALTIPAMAINDQPPEFAGADGSGHAFWDFTILAEDNAFPPNCFLYEPDVGISDTDEFFSRDADFDQDTGEGTAFFDDTENRLYSPKPEGTGDFLTLHVQWTWEAEDCFARDQAPGFLLEVWDGPDWDGGGYGGGCEADCVDQFEDNAIDLGGGLCHTFEEITLVEGEQDVAAATHISWLIFCNSEFGNAEECTVHDVVVNAVRHESEEPPTGTGASCLGATKAPVIGAVAQDPPSPPDPNVAPDLTILEEGETSDTFEVYVLLDIDPNIADCDGNVIIVLDPNASGGCAQYDLNATSCTSVELTFTESGEAAAQTVTVTAVDDDDDFEPTSEKLGLTIIAKDETLCDPNFFEALVSPSSVSVNIVDNDTASIDLSTDFVEFEEGGDCETVEVVLGLTPGAGGSVEIICGDVPQDGEAEGNDANEVFVDAEAILASFTPGSVTFDSTDFATPKTITLCPGDDDELNGEIPRPGGFEESLRDRSVFCYPVGSGSLNALKYNLEEEFPFGRSTGQFGPEGLEVFMESFDNECGSDGRNYYDVMNSDFSPIQVSDLANQVKHLKLEILEWTALSTCMTSGRLRLTT
jgi:hypothetical protein